MTDLTIPAPPCPPSALSPPRSSGPASRCTRASRSSSNTAIPPSAWALSIGTARQTLGRTLDAASARRTTAAVFATVAGPYALLVSVSAMAGTVRGNLTPSRHRHRRPPGRHTLRPALRPPRCSGHHSGGPLTATSSPASTDGPALVPVLKPATPRASIRISARFADVMWVRSGTTVRVTASGASRAVQSHEGSARHHLVGAGAALPPGALRAGAGTVMCGAAGIPPRS